MLGELLFRKSCENCEQLRALIRSAERDAHQAELDAVKWETLAEVRKSEIERLERILAGRQTPTGGGFVPIDTTPEEPEQEADGPDFDSRVSEILGDGLSAAELERRQFLYRKRELDSLLAERNEITAELREMQGTE